MAFPNLKEVIAQKQEEYEKEQRERAERLAQLREDATAHAEIVTKELVARVGRYWRIGSWSVDLPYKFSQFGEFIAQKVQENLLEANPSALVVAETKEETVFLDNEDGGTFEDTGRVLTVLTLTL